MKKILLLITPLFFSTAYACPLAGEWQSNKDKTMPGLQKADLSEQQRSRTESLLGEVHISYNKSCTQATATIRGKANTLDFKVLKQDKNSITVEDEKNKGKHVMNLKGDCYTMVIQGIGVDEYYCRVKTDKKNTKQK